MTLIHCGTEIQQLCSTSTLCGSIIHQSVPQYVVKGNLCNTNRSEIFRKFIHIWKARLPLLYWLFGGKVLVFHDVILALHRLNQHCTALHFHWQSTTIERYPAPNLLESVKSASCNSCKVEVLELICQQTGLWGAVNNWDASVKVDLKGGWICKLHFQEE